MAATARAASRSPNPGRSCPCDGSVGGLLAELLHRGMTTRVHEEMHLVLEAGIFMGRQQGRVIGAGGAEVLDPGLLDLTEIVEHVGMDERLVAGMADAHPHAAVVVA